ncbi:hypothetical protein D9756_001305 [Leucocoprinus leucothites]|uniref:Uncharacterized protein n=1 Tax=Leucocoprinus leucothites TaxID=201217 RepID=A0A8H5LIA8_9AGAR|nr:hypothetical protein D9756_001305 [Leucoagaricus leucothites]
MHTKKLASKWYNPAAPGRLPRGKERRSRQGNTSSDIRMRSPSLRFPRDLPSRADNDQTLISQFDDNDNNEWTDEEPGSDGDADYFHWEEEATLFSDLLEEAAPGTGDADLVALAESLQQPFDDESRQLKKTIARTFVPVVNKIKEVFSALERTVDVSSGAGILALNDACRELEDSISSQHGLVQKHQTEYQARVTEFFGALEEEYARRDQLWADFEKAMNELAFSNTQTANPVLEMLNEAPAKMERTIASIEKQSRNLEKEAANLAASATEQVLKDLLSKLK